MAEYYSAELSVKVVRGLTENALKCKYSGGTLSIGYTVDSEQYFQINPLTAPAVIEAFQHYANGASMQQITDEMNLKGIRTKRVGKISVNSVTSMLHNRKYIGDTNTAMLCNPAVSRRSFHRSSLTVCRNAWQQTKKLRQNTKPKTNTC